MMDDISQLARQMLLDWALRSQILAGELTDESSRLSDSGFLWLEDLRHSPPEEASRKLWASALANRKSSWSQLYDMLDPHLLAIRKEMFRIIRSMNGNERYEEMIKSVIRHWPGSVTRTPSSVIWMLAITKSTLDYIPASIYSLAAACAFYYQGVVIFDDIADGELEPICATWPRGQVEHLAYSMSAALPLAAIIRLACPADVKMQILQEFTQAIWVTNIGQFEDIATNGLIQLSEEQSEMIAQLKTGIGIARLSRMACRFLGLNDETTNRWEQATLAFASARQIASDVCDLWCKPFSPDIASGKCTLPIAYALQQLDSDALQAFQGLRRRCQYEQALHQQLRVQLEQMDVLKYTQRRLEQWRERGQRLLDELPASETVQHWIHTWARQADIFGDIC